MATAAVAGIGSALAGIGSALGSQSRRDTNQARPVMESALPILAAADKKKLKILKREADKERILTLVQQPEVMGLVITLGGMMIANNMPFSSKKAENEALRSVAVTASVLLGLGYAGVGDLTTLVLALGAGGLSLLGNSGIGGTGLFNFPSIPGIPDIPGLNSGSGSSGGSGFSFGLPGLPFKIKI